MVLFLTEISCTLLKERLKSGQNFTENQTSLRTPERLIFSTRLKKSGLAKTLAYYIRPHNDFVYQNFNKFPGFLLFNLR